jgi:uncharacterized protein YgbK (DUF1537 family)
MRRRVPASKGDNAMLLGCIADDLTGATDLAVNLQRGGLSVVQVNGVPAPALELPPVDAVVVALKSRTIAAPAACAQSLAALAWLRARGAARCFFKYCSTFDSTPAGNIGPVSDALAAALAVGREAAPDPLPLVPTTPAYPRNQRTVYRGHLFVGDSLLSDTGMREHPLTPMTDANLVRVLQAQTARRVGRVPHDTVAQGPAAIAAALAALAAEGAGHALLDAVTEAQLLDIGRALRDAPLAAGGAGLGHAWAVALAPQSGGPAPALPAVGGRAVVLAGSCSEATRRQIDAVRGRWPCATLDADALIADAEAEVARLAAWVSAQPAAAAVLVAASLPPADLRRVQARHGAREAAAAVEAGFRQLASRLLEQGVRRFIVAGGETSGAVVEAVTACTGGQVLRIGPEVAPGVPQTVLLGTSPVGLVLKSGNFGGADFFMQALGFTPDR